MYSHEARGLAEMAVGPFVLGYILIIADFLIMDTTAAMYKQAIMACLAGLFSLLILPAQQAPPITLGTLLEEMQNRKALTYFPEPAYSLKQFSSYDRRTQPGDEAGWFANEDYSHFLRADSVAGRRELVLFDQTGPGAVVRWWMTFTGEGGDKGILRIYLDGQAQPIVEDSILQVLAGTHLATYPLQASVSPDTDAERRGHNLYFPIPYAQACKITYECDSLEFPSPKSSPKVYYNISYRSYESDIHVESLPTDYRSRYGTLLENALPVLANGEAEMEAGIDHIVQIEIPANTAWPLYLEGQQAISQIQLRLKASTYEQALRSTVLQISFDGFPTVWVPLGDFMGTGHAATPYRSWNTEVGPDSTLTVKWIMPFQYKAEVRLINYGEVPIWLSGSINTVPYEWKKSSLYFAANWKEYAGFQTAGILNSAEGDQPDDLTFIDLEGKGRYVGDIITLFNTDDAWWGEGDEKIYVDGETFPSTIGTGTEDYYGYAWARPEAFSHPFIAQPSGAGNFYPGMTTNLRYRALDAIPFHQSLTVDMELLHWVSTPMNYAITTLFYTRTPYLAPKVAQVEAVRRPVPQTRQDLLPARLSRAGYIEGEHMWVANAESRRQRTQYMPDVNWRNGGQLWWHEVTPGDSLTLGFEVETKGLYEVQLLLTQATDYGKVQFLLNNNLCKTVFDGYIPEGIAVTRISLGRHSLPKGWNYLGVLSKGKHPDAKASYMFGIDALHLVDPKAGR